MINSSSNGQLQISNSGSKNFLEQSGVLQYPLRQSQVFRRVTRSQERCRVVLEKVEKTLEIVSEEANLLFQVQKNFDKFLSGGQDEESQQQNYQILKKFQDQQNQNLSNNENIDLTDLQQSSKSNHKFINFPTGGKPPKPGQFYQTQQKLKEIQQVRSRYQQFTNSYMQKLDPQLQTQIKNENMILQYNQNKNISNKNFSSSVGRLREKSLPSFTQKPNHFTNQNINPNSQLQLQQQQSTKNKTERIPNFISQSNSTKNNSNPPPAKRNSWMFNTKETKPIQILNQQQVKINFNFHSSNQNNQEETNIVKQTKKRPATSLQRNRVQQANSPENRFKEMNF